MTIGSQFVGLWTTLARYFAVYGGWKAIISSPLFLISCVIVAICGGYYDDWDKLIQAIVPNLLGFSLGTYALLSAIIAGPLKAAFQQKKEAGHTQSDEINASFFHFILIQSVAIIVSFLKKEVIFDFLAKKAISRWPEFEWYYNAICTGGNIIGSLLFVYSIVLVVGAAIAIYRLATLSMRLG